MPPSPQQELWRLHLTEKFTIKTYIISVPDDLLNIIFSGLVFLLYLFLFIICNFFSIRYDPSNEKDLSFYLS